MEGAYTSTRAQLDGGIEPPAQHIHIIDEPIPMPPPSDEAEETPDGNKPD